MSIANLLAIAISIFMFQGVAHADFAASEDCQTELSSKSVTARLCAIGSGESLVIVEISGPDLARPTVVKAQFKASAAPEQFAASKRLWKRLWVESGSPSFSQQTQLLARKAIFLANPASLSASTHSVLDFLVNFVEPDQPIENLDRTLQPDALWGFTSLFHYTMICDAVGQYRPASFTAAAGAGPVTQLVLVGEPATKCRGRCGYGCQQPFQWRTNQYTQECLDHDVCRDTTESIFGNCKDEFWAAAFGYLVAPDCPSKPQSTPDSPITPADGNGSAMPTPTPAWNIGEPPYP